jgi:hypothetical protein
MPTSCVGTVSPRALHVFFSSFGIVLVLACLSLEHLSYLLLTERPRDMAFSPEYCSTGDVIWENFGKDRLFRYVGVSIVRSRWGRGRCRDQLLVGRSDLIRGGVCPPNQTTRESSKQCRVQSLGVLGYISLLTDRTRYIRLLTLLPTTG